MRAWLLLACAAGSSSSGWPVVPGGEVVSDAPQALVVVYPPGAPAGPLAQEWRAALLADGWVVGPVDAAAAAPWALMGPGPDGRSRRLTVSPLPDRVVVSVVVVHAEEVSAASAP